MNNLKETIKESFIQYSGAVLQSRALVDVRDCLKPSARQIFYALYTDKFLYSKPYKKTLKAVGSLSRFYIHGDSSAVGILMRASQNFAMRYPLTDVKGNGGTLLESGNWAHQRYTETRLSELTCKLFEDIDKDTILSWRDNYDNTETYPSVIPSKGFYNIVNGTQGVGIGMASSVPQYNIKEVNNALIKLLWNPNCSFEEIYCAPDFATGGILLNESEVKESMESGRGASCKLRANIEYDEKEKCLVVTEIPYSVYTNTICAELDKCLESEDNPGIDRYNDLTNTFPLIKIYLTKYGDPNRIIRYLYKNTSLQSYYGINMTMLEDGRFPRVFTWKEALQAHLNHEIEVYRRGYEYDRDKLAARIHILKGLLVALASIDEVVQTIKSSNSTTEAQNKLMQNFLLDEPQTKAILDMKLSRLAHLEVEKISREKVEKEVQIEQIENILNNKELLYREIEKGLREMASKLDDGRRTKILDIESENDEPIEVKKLLINITNKNNIYATETSSLYTQKKGSVGSKVKLAKDEFIITTVTGMNNESILFFTENGNYYSIKLTEIPINSLINIGTILPIYEEAVCAATIANGKDTDKNIVFVTSNGLIKKSEFSEYNINRKTGSKAITLAPNAKIVSCFIGNNDKLGIATKNGKFLLCNIHDIKPIGRAGKGVAGIKLDSDDIVVSAKTIDAETKELVTVTQNGYCKRTQIQEFTTSMRGGKGIKIQSLLQDDCLVDFTPINQEQAIILIGGKSQLKTPLNQIKIGAKGAAGVKAMKTENCKIVKIVV